MPAYCYVIVDIIPNKRLVLKSGEVSGVNQGHINLKLEGEIEKLKPVGHDFDTHRLLEGDMYIVAFIHKDVEEGWIGLGSVGLKKYNYSVFDDKERTNQGVILLPSDKHMMDHMIKMVDCPYDKGSVFVEMDGEVGIIQYKKEK